MSLLAKFVAISGCVLSLCPLKASYLYTPDKVEIPAIYCSSPSPETCLIDELLRRFKETPIDNFAAFYDLTRTIDNGLLFMTPEQATEFEKLNQLLPPTTKISPEYLDSGENDAASKHPQEYLQMFKAANTAKLGGVTKSMNEVVKLTKEAVSVKMNVHDRVYPQRRIASIYLHRGDLDTARKYIMLTKDLAFPDQRNRSSRYPPVGDPAIYLIVQYLKQGQWMDAYNLATQLKQGRVYCAENFYCRIEKVWHEAPSSKSPEVQTILKDYCHEQFKKLTNPENAIFISKEEYASLFVSMYGQHNEIYRSTLENMINAKCFRSEPELLESIGVEKPFLGGDDMLKLVRILKGDAVNVLQEEKAAGERIVDADFVRDVCELQKNLQCLTMLEEMMLKKGPVVDREETREKYCFESDINSPKLLKDIDTRCLLDVLHSRAFYAYPHPGLG